MPLIAVAWEILFTIHARRTNELESGWLAFDGKVLAQHSSDGNVVATIDTTKPFEAKCWTVAGNYVMEVSRDGQKLVYTSKIDGAQRLVTHVLKRPWLMEP